MTALPPEASTLHVHFLCGVFPQSAEAQLRSRSNVQLQFAANHFQWALIDGLAAHAPRVDLHVLNAPFVGSYPGLSTDFFFRDAVGYEAPGSSYRGIKFLNLFGFKQLDRFWRVLFHLRRNQGRLDRTGQPQMTLVYSAHTPFLWAAIVANAFRRRRVPICLVVPDLPEYFDMSKQSGLLRRTLKKLDGRLFRAALLRVDRFALLTAPMAERLGIAAKPHMILEGIYQEGQAAQETDVPVPEPGTTTFLYTGGLAESYGVVKLIDAFMGMGRPDVRLWIAGLGESRDYLEECARRDTRITFFGQLPSATVRAMQRSVDFLVNPRSEEGEFTKFSFPSKVVEYMASGTPTLIYRLSGISDEYYAFVETIPEGGTPAMTAFMERMAALEPEARRVLGLRAQMFIREHKMAYHQCSRLLAFMNGTPPS
jgi:glycosyltransferase involved in cell wall biosynthesis